MDIIFRSSWWLTLAAVLQGAFYMASGLWPLVSMQTFLAVTGPKEELWLVQTVGLCLLIVGITLVLAGLRRRVHFEIVVLGAGIALALAVIDVVHFLGGRLPPIYLVDAAVELLLVVLWVGAGIHARHRLRPPDEAEA